MSVKILQKEYKAYLKSTIRELAAYKIAYEEKVKHKIEAEIRLDSDDRLYVSRLQLTATRLQGFESFFNGALSDAQVEPVHIEDNLCDVPQSLKKEPTKYDKWLYQDVVYGVSGLYSDNKKKLLILDFADKERQKFERLAAKFSTEQTEHVKQERTRLRMSALRSGAEIKASARAVGAVRSWSMTT